MVEIAIISFTNYPKGQNRPCMAAVMSYAAQEQKTLWNGRKLVTGVGCTPESAYSDFLNTKLLYHKEDQRMFYQMAQAFPKGEDVPPEVAHEMAVKLAEHFRGHEVLVCTHVDRGHIHSHLLINSVSFETGKKLHISENDLTPIRQRNDRLCREYGFSVYEPREKKQVKSMPIAEYHAAAKGQSRKFQLMNAIDDCMKFAGSRKEFIQLMVTEGCAVRWEDTRKNITYTTPDGMKCRDDRLRESKYLKEMMELELRIRQELIAGGTETAQPAAAGPAAKRQLSADAGGSGRTVLDAPHLTGADENNAGSEPNPAGTARRASGQGGTGQNPAGPGTDTAELLTGWETERTFFFSPQAKVAESGDRPGMADYHSHAAGLAGNLVQLGHALERTANILPVTDATTRPVPKTGKKKKLAVGQKEDDHSGYDFEMKM